MRRRPPIRRGVSLIEAVVALAVMAFGMLAYVGLQSALRFNSDVAKQRAEAVRLAQEAIEHWRAYVAVEQDSTLVDRDAAELSASLPAETITPANTNTVFTRTLTVSPATAASEPRMKTVVADVSWLDRNGDQQSVRFSTVIAASPPELVGTLAVPAGGSPLRRPQGRSPNIPQVAKDLGDGTSAYKPLGAPGGLVAWVFDNATGLIVGVCNSVTTEQSQLTAADVSSCIGNVNGVALSGFVRFATGLVQPTAADSENPTGTALNLSVSLTLTSTGHPAPGYQCFADAPTTEAAAGLVVAVPYDCAVFFQTGFEPLWSGISLVVPEPFTTLPVWTIAANADDADSSRYKVCRYTPATSDAVTVANALHPRNYADVKPSDLLRNQNFLVIRAGDGTTPFQCPADVDADPAAGDLVNSNTLLHQPAPTAP